jgi:hypothetical protein
MGLSERVEVRTGSMFDQIPAGGDAYLLKWIMHDWDDDTCAMILRKIRKAIASDGVLIVIESVVPDRVDTSISTQKIMMADLTMMVHLSGRERTEKEFTALFNAAGFRLSRVVPANPMLSLLEALPV